MLDILAAQCQFFAELSALPMYSEEDRNALVQRVCQGDREARQELVLSVLPLLLPTAWSCASWCDHLSVPEMVQVGCETVLRCLDRALWIENPVGYLVRSAQNDILRACSRRYGLITVPRDAVPYSFVGLDEPVAGQGNHSTKEHTRTLADILPAADGAASPARDHTALYDALAHLSEDRRELLIRRYGLFGCPTISLLDLAQEMYPDLPKKQAYNLIRNREQRALMALQTLMASAYLPEVQEVPEDYYTASEIRERFGANGDQLRLWVKQGRITRYPAPDGVRSQFVPFVYNRGEVDAVVKDWQPRKYASRRSGEEQDQSAGAGPLTRRSPERQTPDHAAKTPRRQRRASVACEEVA